MVDNSGSGGVRRASRKKGKKPTTDDAAAKTVGSNEGIQGATGNTEMPQTKRTRKSPKKMMEKTQDSTEFEPVHVASRPAVSKNKVKRNLWDEAIPAGSGAAASTRPPSSKDRNSGRALPGSNSGSNPDRPPSATVTGSSASSASNGSGGSIGSGETPGNKMKKRLRESAKLANGKTEEEDTIFQKVKGGQRPAVARMRSHKDRKSKERLSKRKEKEVNSLPAKMRHAKKVVSVDEEAPTKFETVHADSRPAIVVEKRRKGSTRKETHGGRKQKSHMQHSVESPPVAEAGETVATIEEKDASPPRNRNAPTPENGGESPGNGDKQANGPEAMSNESICPNGKMVSVDSPANCEEHSESSQFVEEMDVPELPGYQFEVWKASSKPKPPPTSVMLAPTVAPTAGGGAGSPKKDNLVPVSSDPQQKARSPTQKSEYYYKKY